MTYLDPRTLRRVKLIDIDNDAIKIYYDGHHSSVHWTQNPVKNWPSHGSITPVEDINGMQYDNSNFGLDLDLSGGQSLNGEISDNDIYASRKRRSIVSPLKRNRTRLTKNRAKRNVISTNDHLLANLPVNRTINFDCLYFKQENCAQGKFKVTNLKKNSLVSITLDFAIDLKKVTEIMAQKRDIVVVRSSVNVMKSSDKDK